MKNNGFHIYIKGLRIKAGLTQSDVADHLGYKNAQFISNWERGICLPSAASLSVLAKLYNVSLKKLFNEYMSSLSSDLWKKASGSK